MSRIAERIAQQPLQPPRDPATGPTAQQLRDAAPEQARALVDGLTPESTKALTEEVGALAVAERQDLANNLAGKLEAPQLIALQPVFGNDTIAQAVRTSSPAAVRDEFARQSTGGNVTRDGNQVVVETSDNNDDVRVSRDAPTGDVTVTVNGQAHRFTAQEAEHITIRTHGGNDVIEVAPDMQVNFTVEGGDGNDIIAGGAGADTLDGGAGSDRIIGGLGSDRLVGGSGGDTIEDTVSPIDVGMLARGIAPRGGGGNDIVDAGEGRDTVRSGDGDDQIDGGTDNDNLDAGEGQDKIVGGEGNDRIQAGAGHDDVDAGIGDDYVDGFTGHDQIRGGDGLDTLYGGEGDDTVDGGAGKDYLDGYLGNDVISGGDGDDVLSGGQGEDSLFGGIGNDVVYTGAGRDVVGDFDGTNTVYYQGEDNLLVNDATRSNPNTVVVEVVAVPDNIRIEGSPEFEARMRADLETLAASPTGQQMLAEIQKQGDGWRIFGGDNTLTIRELRIDNGLGGGDFGGDGYAEINPAFHFGDSGINADDPRAPPIAVLYHELAHARAAMSDNWVSGTFQDSADPGNSDTGVNNAERQAVGLTIDHDNDPATAPILDPDHPAALTENGLRAEMGYGPRQDYSN